MLKRIITALILIPLIILIILKSHLIFDILILLMQCLMLYEYFKAANLTLYKTDFFISLFLIVIGSSFNFLSVYISSNAILLIIFSVLFILIAINLLKLKPKIFFKKINLIIFGILYISILNFFHYIYNLNNGSYLILLLLTLTWISDSGSYFSGMFFGKRKPLPHLSPNKSTEGFIGGFLSTIILGFTINYYFIIPNFQPLHIFILCVIIGITTPMGDLISSAVKRSLEIKDFGNVFPGHGGILDRTDSLLFNSLFIYYLLKLFY